MGKDVIVACDFASREEVLSFLDRFTEEKPYVKIGMELFYGAGPDIVREIKGRGHRIFLDLKLHDIPNTVKRAMAVLSSLDVDMCNLHAGGTVAMMEAALEGLTRPDGTRPLLIAVTQLTSTSQERMEKDLLIREPMDQVVMHYAHNARLAGLDGLRLEGTDLEAVLAFAHGGLVGFVEFALNDLLAGAAAEDGGESNAAHGEDSPLHAAPTFSCALLGASHADQPNRWQIRANLTASHMTR